MLPILLLLQGTAGFGIGKGANEAVAVKKALRAARRDLIFVDRYKVLCQTTFHSFIWICVLCVCIYNHPLMRAAAKAES